MRRSTRVRRHIAPRLASGESRVPSGNGLPPLLKFALREIADHEGRSFSWVVEQILIDWARHDPRLHRMLRGDALAYKAPSKSPDEVEAEIVSVRRTQRKVREP